jgi:hypothetical protein
MFGHLFDAVFNLDDKFYDPDHNLQNQLYLEDGLKDKNVKPIPVVHDTNDPFGEFKMYADLGHNYIAIGSTERLSEDVFNKIEKTYPNVKLHMFGTLERKMLFRHKPYSADSSVAAQDAKVGNIMYWDPIDNQEYNIDLGARDKKKDNSVHLKDFHHQKELTIFLEEIFSYRYQDLLNDRVARQIVNMYFLWQLEDRVNNSGK